MRNRHRRHDRASQTPPFQMRMGLGIGQLIRLRFGPEAPLTERDVRRLSAENPELPDGADGPGRPGNHGTGRRRRVRDGIVRLIYRLHGTGPRTRAGARHLLRLLGRLHPSQQRDPKSGRLLGRAGPLGCADRTKDVEEFAPLCPDFVVELRSRTDRPAKLRKKMREYMAQGARLGWLIDPIERQGRNLPARAQGRDVGTVRRRSSGEDVLPGFVLDLKEIITSLSEGC